MWEVLPSGNFKWIDNIQPIDQVPCPVYNVPLGNCTNAVPTPTNAYKKYRKCKEEQQESAMRTCIDTTYDSGKDYVIRRIEELAWKKHCEVTEQYTPVYPKNAKQALEWFKEGNFRLSQSMDEDECDGMTGMLEWGKEGPDFKARDAKYKAVKDAKTDAIDTVYILTDEAARLKALKDFESFTVN